MTNQDYVRCITKMLEEIKDNRCLKRIFELVHMKFISS